MDQSRRDFFRNLGVKSAGITASIITPTITYTQFREEIDKVASNLNKRIIETTSEMNDQVRSVTDRMDASALMLSFQQAQINLIFLLLILSFAIDGGMTLFWLLY